MKIKFAAIFISGLFLPILVWAQSPAVVSFSASPTNFNSGYPVSFYWTLQNAGGYSFYFLCSSGIKFKISGGASLSCETKKSSTAKVNDYLTYEVHNVSGSSKSVTVRLIPKTAAGQDYDAAASDLVLNVAALAQPITSFSTNSTTTSSGKSVTINWTSQVIEGVNLMMECQSDVRASVSGQSASFLPCGQLAFATDLAASGSQALNFFNSSRFSVPLKLTLLPAVSPKSYDGTHAAYLNLTIASDILSDPEVTFFTASSSIVNSGESLLFKWGVDQAVGANIQIACGSYVAVATSSGAADLSCGIPLFSTALATSSSLNLFFKSQDNTPRTVILSLMPSKKAGEYDLTRAKNLSIAVKPAEVKPWAEKAAPAASAATSSVSSSTTTAVNINVNSGTAVKNSGAAKFLFTQFLRKGSRGAQVTALQEFLKKDTVIYPEGIVSGYFGSATERAVQRFQKKYGIVSFGSPSTTSFGLVGPKTRTKLNNLQ